MDEREDLELLLARIQQFRTTQIEYSIRKNTVNEKKKVTAERALDDVVKTMLKKGYDPTRFMTGAKTNNLF